MPWAVECQPFRLRDVARCSDALKGHHSPARGNAPGNRTRPHGRLKACDKPVCRNRPVSPPGCVTPRDAPAAATLRRPERASFISPGQRPGKPHTPPLQAEGLRLWSAERRLGAWPYHTAAYPQSTAPRRWRGGVGPKSRVALPRAPRPAPGRSTDGAVDPLAAPVTLPQRDGGVRLPVPAECLAGSSGVSYRRQSPSRAPAVRARPLARGQADGLPPRRPIGLQAHRGRREWP